MQRGEEKSAKTGQNRTEEDEGSGEAKCPEKNLEFRIFCLSFCMKMRFFENELIKTRLIDLVY